MRIQINLGDELVKDVDALADRYGITRSSLCAMLIGQGVASHNEAFNLVKDKEKLATIMASMKVTGELK